MLKKLWIKYNSIKEYHRLYARYRKSWTIEKKVIFVNLTDDEKKEYYRNKMSQYRKSKRDLKLKQLREWQNIVKTAENLMKTNF